MTNSNLNIFKSTVDDLSTLVEEGARAGVKNISRFIEPAHGTLRRAISKRHHIVFGRRGSGKSSLLYKSSEELDNKGHPVAFVDLEPFKGHQYPDIIISVLIATLKKFHDWLENYEANQIIKRLWYTAFILKKRINKEDEKKILLENIQTEIDQLIQQLYLTDDATLKQTLNSQLIKSDSKNGSLSVGTQNIGIEASIARSVESSRSKEQEEVFKRNKKDFLLRKIIDYQLIFQAIYNIKNLDAYLFLDDLYHILRRDQPDLIDYFHKISKGNFLWIKIATIRNRTTWYIHTPQPIGVKIGDDIDEINLDLTLEKFSLSKSFLSSVLEIYIKETKAPIISELLVDGAIDRLVLSSGGVARDFLGLFRRSIDETRDRLKRSNFKHARGPKIGAEDVNLAAGNYGELKREEFQRDTLDDRSSLEGCFNKIRSFCLETTKKNIFLIDQDITGNEIDLIQELLDLRLLHQIKSRVTVSARPGKIYKAYLLDVSQYLGERARRDVEMIDFWKDMEKEKLRRASSIYNPLENFVEDGQSSSTKTQNQTIKKNKPKVDKFDPQIRLDL